MHAIIWRMKGFRFPVVLFAVAVVLAGCKLKEEAPPPGSGPPPIPAPKDVAAPPKDALMTPSGIASKVLGWPRFDPSAARRRSPYVRDGRRTE
jgi:hypothetical protein